jgi:hypothetical protein
MLASKVKIVHSLNAFDGRLTELCRCALRRSVSQGGTDRLVADPERSKSSPKTFQNVGYKLVIPGQVSPIRAVPESIVRPEYLTVSRLSKAIRDRVTKRKPAIEIKSNTQIQGMRDACRFNCTFSCIDLSVVGFDYFLIYFFQRPCRLAILTLLCSFILFRSGSNVHSKRAFGSSPACLK